MTHTIKWQVFLQGVQIDTLTLHVQCRDPRPGDFIWTDTQGSELTRHPVEFVDTPHKRIDIGPHTPAATQ